MTAATFKAEWPCYDEEYKSRLHFLNPALLALPPRLFLQGNAFELILVAFGSVPALVTERGENEPEWFVFC